MRRFALGPELGQCCGGQVDLLVEAFAATERDARRGIGVASRWPAPSPPPERSSRRRRADHHRGCGSRPAPSAAGLGILREGFGDLRRPLILFGAGHVGRALVLALAPLPFTVTWVDPRPDAFPSHTPMNVTLRQLDAPEVALAEAGTGTFAVVMTHSHALDLALVGAALRDARFPYVGLIGSATKRARFEKRLGRDGRCPRPGGIAGLSDRRRRYQFETSGGDCCGDGRGAPCPRRIDPPRRSR